MNDIANEHSSAPGGSVGGTVTVTDSPDPSVAEHVRRYLATGGASGYMEGGSTNLVLTTVGRRTGLRRRTGLFFGRDGDRLVLVASGATFGHLEPPHWYRNLVAEPEAEAQVLAERFRVRAREVRGEEYRRLWHMMAEASPVYHRHAETARHHIPVLVLERVEEQR
ncbi:nitroreductase/quinone reductase family protein [Nocardiopsis ganjiahuensis]|uniref:nitroreductase/quinone reductase family protein n=1 Tax=Nocardiopsis ganjiahuensis TaxID=239984 RepID=UPI00037401D2|nr:nitroreductase/quinone reductase family protein [Nocardiopsis ganjiahuensis]